MPEQYQCPIEGCDYAAESDGSVKAHITRKADPAHKGESGPNYSDEIRTVSLEEGSNGDSGADPEPEPTEPAEPSAATDGGEGVVPDERSWSQSNQSQSNQNQTETPTCPGCGSKQHMNAAVALENNRSELSREHIALLESSELVCTDCGGVFDAE